MPHLSTMNTQMAWSWPILALAGNVLAFYLLSRNPDFKQLFSAKEQEWQVNAIWFGAQHLVSFLLICNFLLGPQIRNKCKNSLLLNVFMCYICLAFPAVIGHLAEYPEFHIKVEDVHRHNSRKMNNLFASCLFAVSSLGLSKTCGLAFESGVFSSCLGYAMMVSLVIVDKTGNKRHNAFILGTYVFCFLAILCRKYLEKKELNDTTRHRNDQSPDDTDTLDQSPFDASNTNDLQATAEPVGTSALNEPTQISEVAVRICGSETSEGLMGEDNNGQRDIRQESWDFNENHGEIFPPSLYNDSSSCGDTEDGDTEDGEEEVPYMSEYVGKEGEDIIIKHLETSHCFAERTIVSEECVGKIKDDGDDEDIDDDQIDDSNSEFSDGEGIDDNDFHGGAGRKLGFGNRHKDPVQDRDCEEPANMRLWERACSTVENENGQDVILSVLVPSQLQDKTTNLVTISSQSSQKVIFTNLDTLRITGFAYQLNNIWIWNARQIDGLSFRNLRTLKLAHSQGHVMGPCPRGLFHSQTSSYSVLFSMPDMYSSTPSSSSVDCTLSLGTPSTRFTEDEEKRNRHERRNSVSNFCWDFLQSKYNPQSNSKSNRGATHSSNSTNDSLLARRCANCDTTSTPLWRNGPTGPKSLCNACGIKFKKEERRATAAAATTGTSSGSVMDSQQMYNNSWYPYSQNQKMPCYSPAMGRAFRFVDHSDRDSDNGIPFLSWRPNVTDRPSLVPDFTR